MFSTVLHLRIMDISCFLVFFRLRIKDSSCFLVDFWAVGLKFTRFTCKLRYVRFVQSLQFFCVVCLSCIFTVFHASCTIDFSSFLIFVGLRIIGLLCFPAFLRLRIMYFSCFLVFPRLPIIDFSWFSIGFFAVALGITRFVHKSRCFRVVQYMQFFYVGCLLYVFTMFHVSCAIDSLSVLAFVGLHIIELLCFPVCVSSSAYCGLLVFSHVFSVCVL